MDERLLDVSLPTLLNQTLPTAPTIRDDSQYHIKPRLFKDRETQTISLNPVELVDALNLASHLESQLEERTSALKTVLTELTQSKLNAFKFHQRIHELEVELDEQRISRSTENAHTFIEHSDADRFDATNEREKAISKN